MGATQYLKINKRHNFGGGYRCPNRDLHTGGSSSPCAACARAGNKSISRMRASITGNWDREGDNAQAHRPTLTGAVIRGQMVELQSKTFSRNRSHSVSHLIGITIRKGWASARQASEDGWCVSCDLYVHSATESARSGVSASVCLYAITGNDAFIPLTGRYLSIFTGCSRPPKSLPAESASLTNFRSSFIRQ